MTTGIERNFRNNCSTGTLTMELLVDGKNVDELARPLDKVLSSTCLMLAVLPSMFHRFIAEDSETSQQVIETTSDANLCSLNIVLTVRFVSDFLLSEDAAAMIFDMLDELAGITIGETIKAINTMVAGLSMKRILKDIVNDPAAQENNRPFGDDRLVAILTGLPGTSSAAHLGDDDTDGFRLIDHVGLFRPDHGSRRDFASAGAGRDDQMPPGFGG